MTEHQDDPHARIEALERELAELKAQAAARARSVDIGGDADETMVATGDDNTLVKTGQYIVAHEGSNVFIQQSVDRFDAVDLDSALGRYLRHLVAHNRYLQLQGIRAGGRLVHIELDRIYIRLRATQQRLVEHEARWLDEEMQAAPGEMHRAQTGPSVETVTIGVDQALADHRRLVVLGDPGSGKTTLLRYLALIYARHLSAQGSTLVPDRLGLDEGGLLPILMPLRQIGRYLAQQADDGTEGHKRLLDFLLRALAGARIDLPPTFFDVWLEQGNAVVLLDGMDEVADPELRRRTARLIEQFVQAYPHCRYVVTSRKVGYAGAARLGEGFVTTTVRDFTLADIEQFLTNWHRMLAAGLALGDGEAGTHYADNQTAQLLSAIRDNDRIRELAINPLMLTVIAMVHRDRVKLPDRRAELYAEAVDVLLGKWDEARGVEEIQVLDDRPFDAGDKRLLLQAVALHMHEHARKDIELAELHLLLHQMFFDMTPDMRLAEQATARFLRVVQERVGLLTARGEGVFAFSHLTFQEYLAALEVADRETYVEYTLARTDQAWWREVILLEAGYLSTQGKERTTRLIRAIADQRDEPEPYHNLVLAAECLHDVGASRVGGNLEQEIVARLEREIASLSTARRRWFGPVDKADWMARRSLAVEAWVNAGGGYWSKPYGEPEWITVPAGEFWMGEDPARRHHVDAFCIAKVPITNAQYFLFVKSTGHKAPKHWEEGKPPRAIASHPVTNVSWRDALAYCEWLSQRVGRQIRLPSEAEWEKAARGDQDKRPYPWGDGAPDATRCNSEGNVGTTTPVGTYPGGASPYGCLDMVGTVREWTRSEDRGDRFDADGWVDDWIPPTKVVRGGSFSCVPPHLHCADKDWGISYRGEFNLGFRVVCPPTSDL
ncbi:MAG: SUMF1/EgtB/PvdO family nonheme iron enzyme [Caldilineaceae bacterium]|nr:SUMF1/EgtB/PvdO family nonheme iron enzyme [Caldilineaceae bacterium]